MHPQSIGVEDLIHCDRGWFIGRYPDGSIHKMQAGCGTHGGGQSVVDPNSPLSTTKVPRCTPEVLAITGNDRRSVAPAPTVTTPEPHCGAQPFPPLKVQVMSWATSVVVNAEGTRNSSPGDGPRPRGIDAHGSHHGDRLFSCPVQVVMHHHGSEPQGSVQPRHGECHRGTSVFAKGDHLRHSTIDFRSIDIGLRRRLEFPSRSEPMRRVCSPRS